LSQGGGRTEREAATGGETAPGGASAPDRALPTADEVATLRRAVERHRLRARAAGREALLARQEARAERTEARQTARLAEHRLRSLERRRSVRLAVALATAIRGAVAAVARLGRLDPGRRLADRGDERRSRATVAAELEFVARLRRSLTPAAIESGPLVSIVMLNRNGERHLRRFLPVLGSTAYRDVELIVVDNGSSDASVSVVEAFQPRFPVRLLANAQNLSFSEANNQALASCAGELVLFLNNDIEPVSGDWLGHLVETVTQPGVSAAGARLIYPRHTGDVRAGMQFADLTLQHGGIHFRMRDGVPIAVPSGAGEDALSPWASGVRDVPALSAACLLVRRADLQAVGGFSAGYEYGQEDVDLCLKLRDRGGRLVYDGRAALWHHESATRAQEDPAARRARATANRDRFVGTWAPRLYRTVQLDAIRSRGFWRREPLLVRLVTAGDEGPAIGSASAREMSDNLERLGWRARHVNRADPAWDAPDETADVILVLDPEFDVRAIPAGIVRVAWVEGPASAWFERPWFDEYDIVLASDPVTSRQIERDGSFRPRLPAELPTALEDWLLKPRIGIRIGVPDWDRGANWGDLHFARHLQRALRRRGWPTRLHLRPAWNSWPAARDDVSLHLFGLAEAPLRPGQLNILWHISHPDRATPELYERYDLVFVASHSFASWIEEQVRVPVKPLHQATDPARFRAEPTGPRHELLFVGNSRRVRRHILEDVLPTEHELAVYGTGWSPDLLDPRYLAGELVPNDQLGAYYASAAIVLSDHWPDMQAEGFMSNRLYDAAAAGAFVISDEVDGLESEFDGGIVAYHDADHLRMLIDHYLDHPDERRALAERARRAVLERHTFDNRVRELVDAIEPLLATRPMLIPDQWTPGESRFEQHVSG
jgi:GT2 family glycosyltransferase